MAEKKPTKPKAKVKAKTKAKAKAKSTAKKKAAPKRVKKEQVLEQPQGSRGTNPFYVLIIMVLITVIVLIVNSFTKKPVGRIIKIKKDIIHKKIDKDILKRTEIEKKNSKDEKIDTPSKIIGKVYFVKINSKTGKMYLSSVKRSIDKKSHVLSSLNELIKGPLSGDKKRGYLTAVPSNLRIRSFFIKGSVAVVDFNSAIEKGATGNILLRRIDQIVYTATQFSNINSVKIKINGRNRKTLGYDGLSISGPIHR